MILKENLAIFLVTLIIVIILLVTGSGLYAPIIFASCAMLFLIFKHLLGTTLRIRYLTLPSFFILIYIIALAIPSLIRYSLMDNPIKNTYLLAVQSVLITFPIGVGMAKLLGHLPPYATTQFVYKQLVKNTRHFVVNPIYALLFIVVIPILLLYFFYAKHIPLIEIIKSYPTNIDPVLLRFSENELPKIVQFLFEILRRFVLPFSVVYTYFLSRFYPSIWRRRFWMIFFFTLLVSLLTLDRAPPITLLILLIISHILLKNQTILGLINMKLVTMAIIALLLGGTISVVQYQSSDTSLRRTVQAGAYVLYTRLLYSPALMSSLSFQAFNYETGLLHGQYVRLFSLLPGRRYTESLGNDPPLSAAPVTFVGDLWRQWGWPSVIIGSIVIGFIYQFIQQSLFTRSKKSIPHMTIFSILLVNSLWIVYGNIFGITTISIMLLGIIFALYTRKVPRRQTPNSPNTSHDSIHLDIMPRNML